MNAAKRDATVALLRGLAAGARTAGTVGSSDPVLAIAGPGAGAILDIAAALVSAVGPDRAEEILRGLVADPAKPITDAELAADVERIKREFGL